MGEQPRRRAGTARRAAIGAGLALGVATWAACLGGVPGGVVRPAGQRPEVLRVLWRRLLTEPPLVEYKPQEFASAASDGTHVFVGSHGGWFYALRPDDGATAWKKAVPGGVSSQPLYHAESRAVIVGGDDGVLHAYDARTGDERWAYATRGPIGGFPVAAGGLIVFANGESRIYAVDAQSGAWRWQYERESPETFTIRGMGSPLFHGGRVYAGFSDGYLVSLAAASGEVVWARSLAGDAQRFIDVDTTPIVVGGTLYAASFSGGVHALDPITGDVRWRYEVEGAGSITAGGGRVWFGATRTGVHCLDQAGRVVWRQALAGQGELSPVSLVRERYLMVSASRSGTYLIDAPSGELIQFFQPGHGVTAPPVSDGERVFVLTNAGYFYAFQLD